MSKQNGTGREVKNSESTSHIREARSPAPTNRIRVQIDFAPAAFEELIELQDLTDAPSRGDTLKYALRTLQWLAREVDDNGVLVVEKNGERARVVFPFLQRSGVTLSVP